MTDASPTDTLDNVIALIRRLAEDGDLPAPLVTAPLGAETRLEQMGLDSGGKVSLLLAIDEQLGIYIPEDKLSPEMSLAALAKRIGVTSEKKVLRP